MGRELIGLPVDHLREYFGRQTLHDYGFRVESIRARYFEQAYFRLQLVNQQTGETSSVAVYSGLYSAGRPSQGINGWVDGDYFDDITFPDSSTVSLSEQGLAVPFFRILGGLIPAGGSLMVSYSLYGKESELHRETKRALDRGYPAAATPLGFLLFKAGCGMGFKDWYFAEGGREGPEKLQGYKARNSEAAGAMILQELREFTSQPHGRDELAEQCVDRAKRIIAELESAYDKSQ